MAPKSRSLPFAVLSILVASVTFQASAAEFGGRKATPLGSWKPINNLKDPWVVEIARFAVAEHNRPDNATKLEFVSVVDGKTQVVAGLNYKLVISAKVGGRSEKPNYYEAVVFDKAWEKLLQLTSFKRLLQG
ncbi:hypothetical protein Pfo_023178 [Paulownia fortunei]|nr:hypothetical protein Pfo_023178 [Paulownia fortunei]